MAVCEDDPNGVALGDCEVTRPRRGSHADGLGSTLHVVHAFDLGPAPIVQDQDDVLRIAGTRVTLDSVVIAFDSARLPRKIVQRYPTLDLAGVYAVIAYMLQHRESVDAYLTEREKRTAEVKAEVEKRSVSHPMGCEHVFWHAEPNADDSLRRRRRLQSRYRPRTQAFVT